MESALGWFGAWLDARFSDAYAGASTVVSVGQHVAAQSNMRDILMDFAWRFVLSTPVLLVIASLAVAFVLGVVTYMKLPILAGWLWAWLVWMWTWLVSCWEVAVKMVRVVIGFGVFVAVASGLGYVFFQNYSVIHSLRQWNETF